MNWWIFGGVVVGVILLGYLGQHFKLIDIVGKGRPSGGTGGSGLVGIGDEIFAPTRHEAAIELDRQTILPAPAPLAGDPLKKVDKAGIYGGRVQIELDRKP